VELKSTLGREYGGVRIESESRRSGSRRKGGEVEDVFVEI
jgi:hypothetical protein